MGVVPTTYEEWEHCITVDCGIPLTADYIAGRIKALNDMSDLHTQKFVERWGEGHRTQTLAWFEEAGKRIG